VVYNRDVAKAIVLACFAPRPTHWLFNISSGMLVSQQAFAEEVMRHCPQHRLSFDREAPAPDAGMILGLFSNSLARAELGYVPDYPGAAGIADYIAHLRLLATDPTPG